MRPLKTHAICDKKHSEEMPPHCELCGLRWPCPAVLRLRPTTD